MNRRLVVFLSLAVIIALLFWYSSVLQNSFYVIADLLKELAIQNKLLAIFVFILTSALAALVSPLTNIPLVPIATLIWGPIPTIIYLLFGWFIGDIIAYIIGRYLGYKAVSYFVSTEKLDDWSSMVKKRATFSTALLLRIALPAELGYAFGIIRYPAGIYIIITFLSELPFAIISAYASEAVLYGEALKFFSLVGILFVVIFVSFRMTHSDRV
ncbi:MAG: putative membrane protein [Parcubacteria group bacterium GW2011_GWC1_42_11]|uniref:Putative membrane protein n=1 Tax=Candidatus Nomurabacteria bacterium GW2011_GWC2_42_20 TaxID=1618756 RepID=A0A0G0ZHF8_9BACT|nr:MAG: putative membrane protein [Parcubacteria group bacterium GW2011_GWC1_42_11]KKS48089.1 MAG: putative membrane protein [Candidatus Nomurabacteria bacterium GW2011_GWC2_42_20]KKS59273.1 MAG: putative membrane protein [Candidatus Nomurabacteria bacterium GW2011_GWA2_42_41]KKT09629.1 MAG: putative membrane protein [Candidatus Nomurabacteria bacterium GW2011_GWB1_43_20]TAN36459.1 MAG: hypothetical protein EPN27_01605 [Patescibacteria group bacterium]HBH71420.1 hypothetical protein [Candidatu